MSIAAACAAGCAHFEAPGATSGSKRAYPLAVTARCCRSERAHSRTCSGIDESRSMPSTGGVLPPASSHGRRSAGGQLVGVSHNALASALTAGTRSSWAAAHVQQELKASIKEMSGGSSDGDAGNTGGVGGTSCSREGSGHRVRKERRHDALSARRTHMSVRTQRRRRVAAAGGGSAVPSLRCGRSARRSSGAVVEPLTSSCCSARRTSRCSSLDPPARLAAAAGSARTPPRAPSSTNSSNDASGCASS